MAMSNWLIVLLAIDVAMFVASQFQHHGYAVADQICLNTPMAYAIGRCGSEPPGGAFCRDFPDRELRTDDGGYRRPWPNPAPRVFKTNDQKSGLITAASHTTTHSINCACNGDGENCFRKDAHFVARNLLSAMAER